jgi:hypothetical protein
LICGVTRGFWPGGVDLEQRDELAPLHSFKDWLLAIVERSSWMLTGSGVLDTMGKSDLPGG